jgi:hypothetical protein
MTHVCRQAALVSAVLLLCGWSDARQTPAVDRFNAAYDAAVARSRQDSFDYRNPRAIVATFRGAWNAMDDVILEQLRAGAPALELAKKLSALHGYRERYSEVLESPPTYHAIPFAVAGHRALLGAYGDSSLLFSGRLSVFVEGAPGQWTRTALHDEALLCSAYLLPGQPAQPFVVAIGSYTHADGYHGELQTWSLADGKLTAVGRRFNYLGNYTVPHTQDPFVVEYDEFPSCLSISMMDKSANTYRLTASARDGTLKLTATSTAPWLEAMDRLCTATRRRDSQTIARLVPQPTMLAPIGAVGAEHAYWGFLTASGDMTAGTGRVTIGANDGNFDVSFTKTPSGDWMVSRVERVRNQRGTDGVK